MGGDGGSSWWWLFLALVWLWMGFSVAEVLNISMAWQWDSRDARLFWALPFGLGFWDIWCAMEPTMEFPASWWSCVVVGVLWWFLDGFELCGVSFMWWSFQVQEMRFRLGGLVVLTGWKEDMSFLCWFLISNRGFVWMFGGTVVEIWLKGENGEDENPLPWASV